jgi:hypothetical protein
VFTPAREGTLFYPNTGPPPKVSAFSLTGLRAFLHENILTSLGIVELRLADHKDAVGNIAVMAAAGTVDHAAVIPNRGGRSPIQA